MNINKPWHIAISLSRPVLLFSRYGRSLLKQDNKRGHEATGTFLFNFALLMPVTILGLSRNLSSGQ